MIAAKLAISFVIHEIQNYNSFRCSLLLVDGILRMYNQVLYNYFTSAQNHVLDFSYTFIMIFYVKYQAIPAYRTIPSAGNYEALC